MDREEQDILRELNKKVFDLNEQNECITRQRDSIIDQSLILRKERDSMIEKNHELQERLRILQEELDRYKPFENLGDEINREINKYGNVLFNN